MLLLSLVHVRTSVFCPVAPLFPCICWSVYYYYYYYYYYYCYYYCIQNTSPRATDIFPCKVVCSPPTNQLLSDYETIMINAMPKCSVWLLRECPILLRRNVRTIFERKMFCCLLKSVLCSNAVSFHINVSGNCTEFDTIIVCLLVSWQRVWNAVFQWR